MSYPSRCTTWDCRRCSARRHGQIIQQLLEVVPCNSIIPKAVVECPVSQSLRKMSLQRNMGPATEYEMSIFFFFEKEEISIVVWEEMLHVIK